LAAVTLAAVLIDLGDIHSRHNADSYVPVLVSIYHWEPYYWEQNRYGMLVALLAKPWSHPFTNLLVQNGITIWCGLASVLLTARFLFRREDWTTGAMAAAAAFAVVAPLQFQWIFSTTFNVFSTSLALGLFGLLCFEELTRRRLAGGVVCFALATWVNSAIGVLLLPLTMFVGIARLLFADLHGNELARIKRDMRVHSAVCIASVAFAFGLQQLAPAAYHTTSIAVPTPDRWWPVLRSMTVDFLVENHPGLWLSFMGVCFALVLVGGAPRFGGKRERAATVTAVVMASSVYIATMGILFNWWRYAAPALVVVHSATVAAAIGPLFRRPPPLWIGALVLAALVPIRHGTPSLARVERELRSKLDVGFNDVIEARATHVAGDYWRVWPIVFAANWRLCDLGRDEPIWGLSHRSMPTERYWKAVPPERTRVAVFDDDPRAQDYRNLIGKNWSPPEKAGRLVIYTPQ
jgi:hypothetical protein